MCENIFNFVIYFTGSLGVSRTCSAFFSENMFFTTLIKKWKKKRNMGRKNAPTDFGQVHWSASIACWYVYWLKGSIGNM
jgi:hypothetical protein